MNSYFMDFQANQIRVSRSFFLQAATNTDCDAYRKMIELRALGMPIKVVATRKSKGPKSLSYDKMRKHIACLTDADTYFKEFEAVRKVSKGQKNPYRYVLNWFEARFPNHSGIPEFDNHFSLINTPADYSEDDE